MQVSLKQHLYKINNLSKVFYFLVAAVILIIAASCFIGIINCLIFIVWLLFFSCLNYLVCHEAKCPATLTPPVSMALIVIVLYISGICGSLHPGFFILIISSITGLVLIIIRRKSYFWKDLVYQPDAIWIYYFLAFVLFIQAFYLGKGVRHVDDMHHWMLIIKGMGFYHKINNYPRMTMFDNYTCGSALWGYFINRLSGQPFSFEITNWANTLISANCFIPGLALFYTNKNKLPLHTFIVIVVAFISFLYSKDVLFFAIGISLIVFAFISLPKEKDKYVNTILLLSYFLIYVFLLVTPKSQLSDYRNLPPDIIIYTVAAAALMAYMACPKLKTIFFISPILAIGYLFKTPGLFLTIAVGISVLVHFTATHFNQIFRSIKLKKYKIQLVYFIVFIAFVSALFFPPKLWGAYCSNHGLKSQTTNFTFSKIEECLFDSVDPQFVLTRKNFLEKIFNEDLFALNFGGNSPLTLFNYGTLKGNAHLSYYNYLIILFLLSVISTILVSINNRPKKYWIITISLLIFVLLHIIGLYINYCLWFGDGNERNIIPAFQRYASPMIKILFILVYCLISVFIIRLSNFTLSIISSLLLFVFSFSFAFASDNSIHFATRKNDILVDTVLKSLPTDVDLINKRMLVIMGSNSRPENFLGMILMKMSHSYPVWAFDANNKNRFLEKKDSYDYFWWLRTDFDSNFLVNKDYIRKELNVEPEFLVNNACLFERTQDNEIKLIYSYNLKNLVVNGTFSDDLKSWNHSDDVSVIHNNDLSKVVLPTGKNRYISQRLHIRSNCFYRVLADINGNYSRMSCGKFGKYNLYTNNNKVDSIFKSNQDEDVILKFISQGNKNCNVSNIQLIEFE